MNQSECEQNQQGMDYYKKKHSPSLPRPKPQCFEIKAQCSPEVKEEERCVLELKPFSVAPHLAFDKVTVGTSKTSILFLRNPSEVQQLVCIEKFPFKEGFQISDVEFSVPPFEEICVEITWTPDKSIGCRENVLFKTSTGIRCQVFFHGISRSPKKKKRKWNNKAIQKSPKRSKILPEARLPVKFEEATKENAEFVHKDTGFATLGTPNFSRSQQMPLHPLADLSDSPIRRQTYTINSIFRASCAGSDIRNFCMSMNQTKDKNILQERPAKFNENHNSNSHDNNFIYDQSSHLELPPKEFRNFASLKEELMKCDENFEIFPSVNENRKTFFLSSANREVICELSNNSKGPQVAVVNPNLQRGINVSQLIQAEKNKEIFNDSLESPTSDLCNERNIANQPCPVDSSAFYLEPHGDETYINRNESLFSSVPSYSDAMNSLQDTKNVDLTNLRDSVFVNKTLSSVAFEVMNTDSPKVSEVTFDLPPFHSSRQNRVTKPKKTNINVPRKQIKNLNLSKAVGTSKNNKDKSPSSDCKPSKSIQPRLNLLKSKSMEKVTQWNPYASFNAYYDEYWKEKQEAAFTNWLNFILTPIDDLGTDDVKVNSAAIWVESMKGAAPMRAPSKEELSFKTYTAVKQLNQLRRAASNLFQSEDLSTVIKKIEKEVDSKKILIRQDRALHKDLGIKKDLLEMLLSYNPLWLRIGLETIYGEMICLQNNNDILGLSRFIIHRFLTNPDINTKFAYSSVINYYKPGYEDCLKRFVLKKFIVLVYFLDVAKRVRLINHNPCLFCKHAKYKNSRSLLLTFSREYLSGEGDITKHLRYLGCIVQHEQMPLEEFDYAVRNIAVDLRCGLRLGRVVEILLQDWSIFKALRANTLNRLAKIHNNEVIFQALEKASIQIEDNIDPRDIVDGNREKTLSLLWQIIFKTQVSKCLNLELLKKENSYLKRSLQLKADVAIFNALQNCGDESESFQMGFLNSKLYKENEVIQQLFQWCQNVCAHYGVKVLNFTTSFSDGRALCFIIHHYHPNLLPQSKIHKETTCHYFEKQMEAAEEDDSLFGYGEITQELKNKLMKNEKENVDIAFQKFQEIGQIPILSFPSHVRNKIPDEKVVITLVSYVNMRLMELSVEIRAARTILLAYRKWCLRRKQAKLKIQIIAVIKIQRYWRNYVLRKRKEKEEAAALCIQCCWRIFSAKKELERLKLEKHMQYLNEKASIIQAAYRKFRASRFQQKHIQASVLLQSHIRKWIQRKKYVAIRSSAIKLQQWWRAVLVAKEVRSSFLITKQLITLLQSHIRRLIAQKELKRKRESAILIQRNVRRVIAQRRFSVMKSSVLCIESWWANILLGRQIQQNFVTCRQAATKIQATWRMYLQKKHFKDLKKAISVVICYRTGKKQRIMYLKTREKMIKLQALFRGYRDRKKYCQKKRAAIKIQSVFKGYCTKKRFLAMKSAAIQIQKYYRCYQLMCNNKHQFLVMKAGFTRLQAQFRGFKTRKELHKQTKAAAIIQSIFRSYTARKKFLSLKLAALKIQKFYRGYQLMCSEKKKFHSLKKGFVAMQASFRGYKARKEFLKQKAAAICIQSVFRGYHSRKTFLTLKSCAIKIQRFYRGYLLMRQENHKLLTQKTGFIKLQAHFRGFQFRKEFRKQKSAAIAIQSVFRSYICKKKFLTLRLSVIKIQKYYRGYKLMCLERKKYLIQKAGFVKMQALYRSYKARKQFVKQRKAAILIQSSFRGYKAKKKYFALKSSAVKIQNYYRGYRLMCSEKQKYAVQKTGFTKLQAQFRAYKARRLFVKQKIAAVLIQSAFRGYKAKKKYFTLKSSAVKIQNYYRGYRLMCSEKQKYAVQKTGFTKLQAQFRAYKARRLFVKQKIAATLIQSVFRGYKAKKKYFTLKSSAVKIQNYYRGYRLMCSEKQKYAVQKTGFTKLQAQFRAYKARRLFVKQKIAATLIQSVFRGYKAKMKYFTLKSSAVEIQNYYRGYRLMCSEKQKYAVQKTGFTKFQAQFRAYKARKEFLLKKRAAIKIQSVFRAFIMRKRYLIIKVAVIKIQKYYRGYKLMCSLNEKYVIQVTGFTKMQALYRSYQVRKQFIKQRRASVVIQSAFRGYVNWKKYANLKSSAIKLQRYYRGYRLMCEERRKFLIQKTGFIKLQAQYRAYKGRKEFCRKKRAIIKVQSAFRGYTMRKRYLIMKLAVLKIQKYYRSFQIMCSDKQNYLAMKAGFIRLQALFRGFKVRKELCKKKKAAIAIQKTFRGYSARKRYSTLKLSAIKIQRYYCGYRLMCLEKQKFLIQKVGFTKLQAQVRAYRRKKEFCVQKAAAIKIQSSFRRFIMRKKYLAVKSAAIKIQKYYRSYRLMCSDKKKYLSMKTGFTKLQAVYRGVLVRNNVKNLHKKAVIIQSYYRRFIAKKHYQELKQKCIIIQRHYRGLQLMRKNATEYHKIRQGIIIIQAAVRCHLMHKRYLTMRIAVIKIQSFIRMLKCRKAYARARSRIIFIQQLYHLKYLMKIKKRSCIQIQASWRGYRVRKEIKRMSSAAVLIQRWWRERKLHAASVACRQWYLRLRENTIKFQRQAQIYLQKRAKAAIKIQTAWRAYTVRRSVTDKKIIQARQKIRSAPSDEYNTLKSRTLRALKVLLADQNVRNILNALQNLEACTRLSSASCERLQESGGLAVIIQMVRTCNRSVPHQEIIKLSTDILLNLCKYKKTVNSVWEEPNSLNTIVSLMHVYKQKGLPIFSKCATLFWIFSQDPEKAEVMKKNSEFIGHIKRFYNLSLLEKKKNEEKRKTGANCTLRLRSFYVNTRESIEPDWILGQRKMREFKDSFTAISALMQSLGLTA